MSEQQADRRIAPTILIVDDDQTSRLLASCSLSASGFEVLEAPDGETALMIAAWSGNVAAIETLARRGADVEVRDRDGVPPLLHAAGEGMVPTVRALVKSGADVNATNPAGESALMFAAASAGGEHSDRWL